MTSERIFVLDSWPVLEWLQGRQPVAQRVSAFFNREIAADSRLLITRINFSEIAYMLPKKFTGQRLADAEIVLGHLVFQKISIDDLLVDEPTELKKRYACSFADCLAAALAMHLNAPVVTGDPEFLQLRESGLLKLEWLGA